MNLDFAKSDGLITAVQMLSQAKIHNGSIVLMSDGRDTGSTTRRPTRHDQPQCGFGRADMADRDEPPYSHVR